MLRNAQLDGAFGFVMKTKSIAVIFLSLILVLNADANAVSWANLSSDQQSVLKSYHSEWSQLSAEYQHRLQRIVQRWQKLSPHEKRLLRARFQRWQSFSSERRWQLRERFEQFKKISVDIRRQLLTTYHWYKQLDPEQQERLRRGWLQNSESKDDEIKFQGQLSETGDAVVAQQKTMGHEGKELAAKQQQLNKLTHGTTSSLPSQATNAGYNFSTADLLNASGTGALRERWQQHTDSATGIPTGPMLDRAWRDRIKARLESRR